MSPEPSVNALKLHLPHRILKYFDGQYVNNRILRLRNKYRSLKLINLNFTVVANNCVSGTLYEDLTLRYQTPFVGLYILPSDFVKLSSDFKKYLSLNLVEYLEEGVEFPVGQLGDIKIYFMHYESFSVAKEKWERRKSRINFSNIGFIFVQRDDCTLSDMLTFDDLDIPNKIILTSNAESGCESANYLSFYSGHREVGNVLEFKDLFTGRRIMYDFNFIQWINTFRRISL